MAASTEPLKVALVSPYDFSHPGGVTEHIKHLGAELRARGYEVKLLAPASGEIPPDMEEDFARGEFYRIGRAFPIPANGSIARITLSFHLARFINRVLEREKFDIIHFHEPLAPALPITVLRASKTCNVGTFHAYAKTSTAYYYTQRLVRRYFRKLHGLITVSEPAREFVSQYFAGDYRVVPNGVDVRRFSRSAAPRQDLRDGKVNILFVGRFEQRKGLGVLLRAYVNLKERLPQLRLIVVGDGRMRGRYERFIASNDIPDIVMAGRVSDEELPSYYASADIFCAPNTGKESFGLILLEAMAVGLPVVATDIPGFAQVIRTGRNGILVRRDDPVGLASAINLLVTDPELRDRLAQNAHRNAQDYAWEKVVDQVEQVYGEALASFEASTFNPLDLLPGAERRSRRQRWASAAGLGWVPGLR
jgi:phosphatidylinositol alpha-mannosyltransferase